MPSLDLRRRLRADNLTAGMMITIGHPSVVEVISKIGYDFVCIDTEHAAMSTETIESLIRAANAVGNTGIIVRVETNDLMRIRQPLDFGADGIMVPLVESAAEAKRIVDATVFSPDGKRGVAGCRAADYGVAMDEYLSRPEPLRLVQIESRKGLNEVEEIAAVDGIDGLFIGPADLSQAIGRFGEFDSEEFNAAVDRILTAGSTASIPVGIYATEAQMLDKYYNNGGKYVLAAKDISHLVDNARDFLNSIDTQE